MLLVISEFGNYLTTKLPEDTKDKRIFHIVGYNSIQLYKGNDTWELVEHVHE